MLAVATCAAGPDDDPQAGPDAGLPAPGEPATDAGTTPPVEPVPPATTEAPGPAESVGLDAIFGATTKAAEEVATPYVIGYQIVGELLDPEKELRAFLDIELEPRRRKW